MILWDLLICNTGIESMQEVISSGWVIRNTGRDSRYLSCGYTDSWLIKKEEYEMIKNIDIKLNVGDKIKIGSKRTSNMNSMGDMDKYLNTIMTVASIGSNWDGMTTYEMVEDGGRWSWTANMFDLTTTLSDYDFRNSIHNSIVELRDGRRFYVTKVNQALTGNNEKEIMSFNDYSSKLTHDTLPDVIGIISITKSSDIRDLLKNGSENMMLINQPEIK